MNSLPPAGRLAPSPSGILHLGNARTFLWAWLAARSRGARLILRIEDLEKEAQGSILPQLLSDLWWLGLDWDEGPVWNAATENRFRRTGEWQPLAETGPAGPYVQRARTVYYRQIFDSFLARGLIYPCVCSKSDYAHLASAPHEGDVEPRYPGTCRGRFTSLAEAQTWLDSQPSPPPGQRRLKAPVWRFAVPDGPVEFFDRLAGRQAVNVQQQVGDFVVFKTPEFPTYQLAVAADDAAMGVDEVVRGDDLLPSCARQILLLEALGAPPPVYGHAPLVVGPDGARLAKRHGDARLQAARQSGLAPEVVVGHLARWSGLDVRGPARPRELLPLWDWAALDRRRVVLTPELLAGVGL